MSSTWMLHDQQDMLHIGSSNMSITCMSHDQQASSNESITCMLHDQQASSNMSITCMSMINRHHSTCLSHACRHDQQVATCLSHACQHDRQVSTCLSHACRRYHSTCLQQYHSTHITRGQLEQKESSHMSITCMSHKPY